MEKKDLRWKVGWIAAFATVFTVGLVCSLVFNWNEMLWWERVGTVCYMVIIDVAFWCIKRLACGQYRK